MTEEEKKPPKRKRRLALYVPAGLFVLLGLLYLLRGVIIEPRLRSTLETVCREQLGIGVTVGDISGSYLTSLGVNDFRTVEKGTTGSLSALDFESLRLRYSLLSLLGGLDAFLERLEVDLQGARIEIDAAASGESGDKEDEAAKALVLPVALPNVRLQDASVAVKGVDFFTGAGGISLVTRPAGPGSTEITLGAEEVRTPHPRLAKQTFALSAGLSYTGKEVRVDEVTIDGGTVADDGRIVLTGLPGSLTFSSALRAFDGTASLQGEKQGDAVTVEVEVADVDLSLLSRTILLPELGLEGTFGLQSRVRLAPSLKLGVEGEVEAVWERGLVKGVAVDRAALEARLEGGAAAIEELDVRTADSTALLRGVGVPLDPVLAGDWKALLGELSGEVILESDNVPAFLSILGLELPTVPTPDHRLVLNGGMADRELSVSSGTLSTENGRVEVEGVKVLFPGAGEGWQETIIRADLEVDIADLGVLSGIFPLPVLEGAARGSVHLAGAVVSPEGTMDASVDGLTVGGRSIGDLSLEARGDSRTFAVRSGSLSQGEGANELSLKGLSASSPDLMSGRWRDLLGGLKGEFSLRLTDIPAALAMIGVERRAGAGELPAHLLEVSGSAGGGQFSLPAGRLEVAGDEILLEGWKAVLPEAEASLGETSLTGTISAALPDLERVMDLLSLPPVSGSLEGSVEVSGTVAAPRGHADLRGRELAFRGYPVGDADLRLEGDAGEVRIETLEVRKGEDRLLGSGRYLVGEGRLEGVRLEVAVRELADVAGDAVPEEWGPLGSLDGLVRVEGTLTSPEATVETFTFARGDLKVVLDGPAGIAWSGEEGLSVKEFVLRGPVGTVSLNGKLTPRGDSSLALEVSDLSGEGWLEEFAGDRFTFSGANLLFTAGGTTTEPRLALSGSVKELRGRGATFPMTGEVDAEYAGDLLRVTTFRWSAGEGRSTEITGTVPFDPLDRNPFRPGEISLNGSSSIADLKSIAFLLPPRFAFGGSARGTLQVTGTWEKTTGAVEVSFRDLDPPADLKPVPPGPLAADLSISLSAGEVELKEVRLESPQLNLKAAGSWSGAPTLTGLIRGEDSSLQGTVDVEGSLSSPDIRWASNGIPKLRRLRGELDGSVSLQGEVRNPDITAEIHIDEGEISYTGVPLLSSLDVDLLVVGKGFEVKKATGELGGAPFELGGSIKPGGEEGPVFDLSLKGESILAYRDRGIRLRADADITAKGPLSKLKIGGSAALVDSHFIRNVDFLGSVGGASKPPQVEGKGLLFSFKDPPLRDLVFDLKLVSKDPFKVKNQYVKGFIRPDLHLGGTGEMPALLGKVYVDPFRIYLPTGTIRTDPGFVIFKQGEPDRPWLELRGRSKMMGYDINMRVDGFYDEPKMTFSSNPPVSDAELLLLVLTGTPPASGDIEAAGSAGSAIAVFLGRGFLGRFFGGGEEAEDMIMDRFETQFGRDITESGDPTIDTQFRLTEDILWRGGALYLTSEKDRYDDFNYGVRFLVQIKNKEKE